MLRYLFVLDIAFAVLGASMVIGVSVSALLLALHLDVAPEQRDSMMALLILTASYTAVTVAAGLGAWGLRRQQNWHWWAQGGFVGAVLVSYFVSIQMLSGQ